MAAKGKPRSKAKGQTQTFLAPVPEENVFWSCDGQVFKDVKQLAEGLKMMTDESFSYHCNMEKNDFYRWVKDVIKDDDLANSLLMAVTRQQAEKVVNDRITTLSRK